MKRKFFKSLLLSVAMLLSHNAFAFFIEEVDPHVYFGVDLEKREVDFQERFGDNLFANHLNQYNVWGQVQFFRYFGLGIGHDHAKPKNQMHVLNEGDYYLGFQLQPGDGIETHQTETRIKGTHLSLLGFYPLCPRYLIDIFGSIGFAHNTLTLTDIQVAQDNFLLTNPIVRSYDENKTVARATLGLQMIFYKYVGARIQVAWEDNSRFSDLKPLENPAAQTDVNLKDSFIYGFGLFVTV